MKEIIWLGNSHEKVLAYPKPIKRLVGYNLDRIQRGIDPKDWKPMPAIGKGVKEIRIHSENEYRVIYTANLKESIYVLHTFIKKNQKTNLLDIDIAKQRFAKLMHS